MHTISINSGKRVWRYFTGLDPSKFNRDMRFEDTVVSSSPRFASDISDSCNLYGEVSPSYLEFPPIPVGNGGFTKYNVKWGFMGKRGSYDPSDTFCNIPEIGKMWHPYMHLETDVQPCSGIDLPFLSAGSLKMLHNVNDDTQVMAMLPSWSEADIDGGKEISLDLALQSSVFRDHLRTKIEEQYSTNFHRALQKTQLVNLGASLAEIAQVKTLIGGLAPGIRRFVGQFGNINLASPFSAYRQLKNLSAAWLEYSYGIRPIIQDVTSLIEGLPQSYREARLEWRFFKTKLLSKTQPIVVRTRVHASKIVYGSSPGTSGCVNREGVVEDLGNYIATYIDGILVYESGNPGASQDYWAEQTIEIRQQGHYVARQDWTRILFTLGLNDIRPAVWEVIPFSFVLDWYYKIGSFITAQTDTQGLDVDVACLATEFKWSVTTSLGSVGRARLIIRDVIERADDGTVDIQLRYPYFVEDRELVPAPVIEAGTMVSKLDARALNASSLLVLLLPTLGRLSGLARLVTSLPRSAFKGFNSVLLILLGISIADPLAVDPSTDDGDPE